MTRFPPDCCSTPKSLRCSHLTSKGRRCRFRISDLDARLCRRHARLHKDAEDASGLAAELIGNRQVFTSVDEINAVLSRLLVLLSQDRISPRRGAVLAYTCNLLLNALPAAPRSIENEMQTRALAENGCGLHLEPAR